MINRTPKALACLVLVVVMLLSMTVSVLAEANIGTDASRPEYFEALGGSGNYNPLKTPFHYDKATGNVAYCLEHEKDSPSSSTEYQVFDAAAVWGQNTVVGIQAIVDHGYPNTTGGLTEEQAHYATANAIRTWMKESADVGYNFMIPEDEHIHPVSGTAAQETWDFFLELIGYARAGATLGGTSSGGMVRVYPPNPTWTVQGDTLVTQIEVQSSDGYSIRRSHSTVEISGFTGGTYDALTITAPVSLLTEDVQLLFEGIGSAGGGVRLTWYEPVSANSQAVVVAELGGGGGAVTGEQRLVTIEGISLVDLTIVKKDGSTDEPLDGAVFSLTDAGGSLVGLTETSAGRYTAGGRITQFTTHNGTAIITGLQAGTYTLTEVSPPTAGYATMDPEMLPLTASATVTVTNIPTEITITKVDGLTQEPLSGLRFELLDETKNPVPFLEDNDGNYRPSDSGYSELWTDENGKIHIIGLPQGTYSIKESTHLGYAALHESPEFTLTGYADIKITNEPLMLQVVKKDGHTGEGMQVVRFKLWSDQYSAYLPFEKIADGEYVADFSPIRPVSLDLEADDPEVLTTAVDGSIKVYYLHEGTYRLEEVSDLANMGYTKSESFSITVAATNGMSDPVVVQMTNDPTVLILSKSDAATREPMDGATFRLVDENNAVVRLVETSKGNYKPDSNGAESFTTKNGEAYIRYLPYGSYTVEELTAPDGYTMDKPKNVTITDVTNAQNPARVAMHDMPLALEFYKVDAENGNALDGCTFNLKDANGDIIHLRKVSDGVYTPDEDGSSAFTTKDGKATIAPINPGNYTISEKSAVKGYALAEDVSVTVTDASTSSAPATVTMQNEKLALCITKVDAVTRQTLTGAVFNLKDAEGNLLKFAPVLGKADTFEVVSTGNENLTIPKSGSVTILKVPAGEYKLIETRAPAGYALPKEAIEVAVTNENTASNPAQIVVENHTLAVQVTKTNGLTGERLEGVRFRIESLTGVAQRVKLVAEGQYRVDPTGDMGFVTGVDGVATILGIAEGTYRLVEENNPGFGRVEPVEFTVTGESTQETPTVIGVENQPLELEITKVDAQTLEPLANVPFSLTGSTGNVLKFTHQADGAYHLDGNGTDTILTDANGKILVRYIPAGTIILTEGEYLGYSMGKPVEITILNEHIVGNPCKVTVENKPIAMEITKTDLLTGAVMEGVEFEILDKDGKAVSFIKQESSIFYPAKEGETGITKLASDKDGTVRIEYLPQGKYALKEQQVTGYAELGTIEFELTSTHTQEEPLHLDVQNLPTRLLIEKQDSVTNQPLTGASFTIADKDGKLISLVKQENGTYHPAKKDEKGITEISVDEKGSIVIEYLPAGKYTVTEKVAPIGYGVAQPIETEVGTEIIRHTVEGAQTTDASGKLLGETSLAVLDHPLALRILKIHSVTKRPLSGAEFQVKADGNLSTPLKFTKKDGVYWYDNKGTVTTITLDENCEALLYGLPADKYHLEESKVPDGYFPIAPVVCTITLENTCEAPLEVTIANAPEVKLGIDSDKYNVLIAMIVTLALSGAAISTTFYLRRRRKEH